MGWTLEQEQAITEEGQNIIVSAGAGSGKTAVLTERVIRKLKNKTHINELLILTFTNAAANEMKERIRKSISATKGLEEELTLIDSAYITTFDAFSLAIVKKYHTRLNISNDIKITDEVVINLALNKILDEIFDLNYLSPKQSFKRLINDFCLKDDKELKSYLIKVYQKISLKYDKETFLKTYIDKFYSYEEITKFTDEYVNLILSYKDLFQDLIKTLETYFDGTYMSKISALFTPFFNATTYTDLKSSLEKISLPPVPKSSPEEAKALKKTLTDLLAEVKDLAIYETVSEMAEEIISTKENATIIFEILRKLDKRLSAYCEENELYSFNDIAHLAIKVVMENADIQKELTNSFKEIMVDEYQDTSDIQELFISLISKNNVYMVGDIKQSIYRFRNANPYIFKTKYDAYRDTSFGLKIDLVKNFRSRKEVLENINLLFNLFMDDKIGGADYKTSHQMVFGNTSYLEEGNTTQDYNLEVLTYTPSKEKNISKDEQEIFIIAKSIKDLFKNGYQIFDKDTKTLRPLKYSDIVILLDKSKSFDLYKKIFEYEQIPLTILKDSSLCQDYDLLVIKSLIKFLLCIKENRYDLDFKYSFVSLCRSFLYKMSDDEIYHYFVTDTFTSSPLYKICLELVKNMDTMASSEFLLYVLEKLDYEEKLITLGQSATYRIRCEYIYNLISNYAASGNTIYDFVTYLDEVYENNYDLKFSINATSQNSCKIMTIHKSKGLEFPICYFASFANRFNLSELKEKILFDNKYGLILPKVEDYYKDTILKTLTKRLTREEEISERIRLLYVALTRAKEKMIMVLPELEEEKEQTTQVTYYEKIKYNSFLSIMKSIYTVLLPYTKKTDVTPSKDYQKSKNESTSLMVSDTYSHLSVTELNISSEELTESHFSKESLHEVTKEEQDLLSFGTKVHETLETLDFTNPILKDIPKNIASKISSFLTWSVIRDNLSANFYKEYEFIYEEDDTIFHGIIDLLIEKEDSLIIVDYKLKNIADSAYDKQLNGYRKALEKKTSKKVECYLYSLLDENFRKIDI